MPWPKISMMLSKNLHIVGLLSVVKPKSLGQLLKKLLSIFHLLQTYLHNDYRDDRLTPLLSYGSLYFQLVSTTKKLYTFLSGIFNLV